jgi:hypothetical protein
MKIIQVQKQKYWHMGMMSTLLVGGAIASTGGYAFAQITLPSCIPSATRPCTNPPSSNLPIKDPPHNPAKPLPPELLQKILDRYPQAIAKLTQEDRYAVQKLKQGNQATLKRLLELAPELESELRPYLSQQTQ